MRGPYQRYPSETMLKLVSDLNLEKDITEIAVNRKLESSLRGSRINTFSVILFGGILIPSPGGGLGWGTSF